MSLRRRQHRSLSGSAEGLSPSARGEHRVHVEPVVFSHLVCPTHLSLCRSGVGLNFFGLDLFFNLFFKLFLFLFFFVLAFFPFIIILITAFLLGLIGLGGSSIPFALLSFTSTFAS